MSRLKRSVLFMLAVFSLMAGAFSGPARADDSMEMKVSDKFDVTFYGVVDESICYATNTFGQIDPNFFTGINPGVGLSAKNATKSVFGVCNNALSDSRVGVKGNFQLDSGYKAVFVLETGFNVSTGMLNNANMATTFNGGSTPNSSLSGQFFNRQSYLGFVSDDHGALTLGRTYNFLYDVLSVYDPVNFADLFSPLSFSGGLGGGAGVSEDTRIENNLKYTKKFGDVNLGLAYKFGGFAGSEAVGNGLGVNLGYETENWGIQLMAEQANDAVKVGAGADPFTTPNFYATNCTSTPAGGSATTTATGCGLAEKGTAVNTADFMAAVKAKVGPGTLKFGWQEYQLSGPSNPAQDAQVNNLYGMPVSVTAYVGPTQYVDISWGGYTFNPMEKLNLALGYYYLNYGNGFTGASHGYMEYWSFLADYSLSKYVDSYFGVMNTVSGVANFTNDIDYALGARFKF
jgi:predicted porin